MESKILLSLTIVMCMTLGSYGGDLPSDIKKCKVGDNNCIRDKIMEIFKKYPNGNPKFGMPNVSALTLRNVTVARASQSSPIQLNFKFRQFVAHGLENTTVLSTSGWEKDPKNIDVEVRIPSLKIIGDYETNGKILLLALDGEGRGEVELIDSKAVIKAKMHLEKRNGKSYATITKIKATLEPKKVHVKMENLFKGNKELSDTLNEVINENWKDFWSELNDGISGAIARILLNVSSEVFNALSYDDFYADSS